MLRLFRSISRGRGQNDSNNPGADNTWSPFAVSPERSRYRALGQRDPDNHDFDEEDVEGDDADYSPRHRRHTNDYFDQTHVDGEYEEEDDEDDEDDEDEDAVETPLLPIFSAAHLDRLPLYNITHAIRLLVVQKCETTLSWDQLRSPQISQFLVKPIQSLIRADHFNRATLCALLANCLQFQKEGQQNPGNVGVSRTRALISELLAMRLLKEFSTRELIDGLSYDFDPLQGMDAPAAGAVRNVRSDMLSRRVQGRIARVSTIEIGIRAEAKRFLAHPLVVQHLEAIWSGKIVFHSEADNLHRKHRLSQEEIRGRAAGYGTTSTHLPSELPADAVLSRKAHTSKQTSHKPRVEHSLTRRTVTLYNPKEASLFKLSRLRVPRYRQVFSTISFATMLALFIAVLVDRSMDITPLEVVFWFWSIGYMLDEVVGFTEQGFGLYILSFWNAFDLGILFLFIFYYFLRLYGIVLAENGKHRIAGIAYDVLASTAILLFPRLFSVLDHYRYFSQLLIAFRMMVTDLMAILVLIVICCSGFFVALALSFADERDAGGVVYSLFQILMGFTPAVWDHWAGYNILGRAIMVIFLTICHFLIVTILITVLTNSFMAIVKNAEEEHQFLFAVNTISMVKSDALFSYVAPTNIIGWALSPLRFIIPLRQYVKFNRTVIKISHFPILFVIFSYERLVMSRSAYGPMELIERQPSRKTPTAFQKASVPYTPAHRLREPSVVSFRKDRALDEVFRRPFRGDTVRTTTKEMEIDNHKTTAVDAWMQGADEEGGASPPDEQPRSVLERLEYRRPKTKRATTSDRIRMMAKQSREFSTATRSIASDPDFSTTRKWPYRIDEESEPLRQSIETIPHDTEADGDDEINDDSDGPSAPGLGESAISLHEDRVPADDAESEDLQAQIAPYGSLNQFQLSHAAQARHQQYSPGVGGGSLLPIKARTVERKRHDRQTSSGTILFAPVVNYDSSVSNPRIPRASPGKDITAGTSTPPAYLLKGGTRTPARNPIPPNSKSRPILPPRQKTAPNLANVGGLSFLDMPVSRRREPSFNARALDLASEIGDNKFTGPSGVYVGGISGMPASFSEQMMRQHELRRREEEDRRRSEDEEKGMVNRIMLARMHTLEEGFREVLKEIKDMSQNATNSSRVESEIESGGGPSGVRGQPMRPKVETRETAIVGSPSWQGPRTSIAVGRIGGTKKTGASPKKLARGNSKKGKENERPAGLWSSNAAESSGTGNDGESTQQQLHQLAREVQLQGEQPSAEPVKGSVEIEASQEKDEVEGARPDAAISPPRPGTSFRTDDLIVLEREMEGEETGKED